MNTKIKKIGSIGFYILGLVILLMLIIGLLKFGTIIGFILMIPFAVEQLEREFGLNSFLAIALGVLLAILISVALTMIFSKNSQKRIYGISLATGLVMFWNLTLFWVRRDYNYDPQTGQPVGGFVYNVEGRLEKINSNHKFNPEDGSMIVNPNSTIINEYNLSNSGLPLNSPININHETVLFDRFGNPKYYYYEDENQIEFFIRGGAHPLTGQSLLPINGGIVKKYLARVNSIANEKRKLFEYEQVKNELKTNRPPIKKNANSENKILSKRGKTLLDYGKSPSGIDAKLQQLNSEAISRSLLKIREKEEKIIVEIDSNNAKDKNFSLRDDFPVLRQLRDELQQLIINK